MHASVRPSRGSFVRFLTMFAGMAVTATASAQITIDDQFGAGGIARTGIATATEFWNDVVVQPDGRIIAVGARSTSTGAGTRNFLVARFLPSGAPDTSFQAGGVIEIDFGVDRFDTATSVALLPDGRILVAGNSQKLATVTTTQGTTFGAYSDIAIVRLNANGGVDTTFGSGGFVRTDLSSGLDDTAARLLVLPGGAIRVAGNFGLNPGNRNVINWALVGYTPGGALDPAFGVQGRQTLVFNPTFSTASASDAALFNNQITVVGTEGTNMVAARFDAVTGAQDASFGTSGIRTIAFAPAAGSPPGNQTTRALSIAIQDDGRAVLVGSGEFFDFNFDTFGPTMIFAARLTAAGAIDPTFSGFPNNSIPGQFPRVNSAGGRLVITDSGGIRTLNPSTGAPVLASPALAISIAQIATRPETGVLAVGSISGEAGVQRLVIDSVAPSPPAAPTSLAAPLVSARSVRLTWRDNSSNETSFRLERASTSTFSDVVVRAELPANTASFTDETRPGTTYYYRVRAANAAGSSVSNALRVVTPRR